MLHDNGHLSNVNFICQKNGALGKRVRKVAVGHYRICVLQKDLLLEIAVVETFEAATVASFVACHFMNGVVDGIEVEFLGALGDAGFVFAGTGFSVHALFEVGLGVPNAVAEEFGKLGSVFSLFPSITLESFGYFGIAFAVGLAAHGEVHTHFGAFAVEMSVEILYHFFVAAFGYADFVLSHERETAFFRKFFELGSRNATHRAFFGSVFAFVNVTTNGANEFLFHNE